MPSSISQIHPPPHFDGRPSMALLLKLAVGLLPALASADVAPASSGRSPIVAPFKSRRLMPDEEMCAEVRPPCIPSTPFPLLMAARGALTDTRVRSFASGLQVRSRRRVLYLPGRAHSS